MSRELKFRAWDKGINKWLCHYESIGGFDLMGECVLFGEWAKELPSMERWDDVIIMQFTGLKDKNGKQLYDQDIIQTDQGTLFIIEFNQQEMQWVLYQTNDGSHRDLQGELFALKAYMTPNITLKGNCYQHPELLKP